ncbi:hypothetical protein C8R45DRAFT_1213193 [Mycena sanguinolenta]|nr:hypothetical protein C8R45DRAFT_1213193 [Mycena sanguinolenta]
MKAAWIASFGGGRRLKRKTRSATLKGRAFETTVVEKPADTPARHPELRGALHPKLATGENPRFLCGIADDHYDRLELDVIGIGTTTTSRMPSSSSTTSASAAAASGTTKARTSTRHAAPISSSSSSAAPAPTSPNPTSPPPNLTLSPTATSKLPRFLQSPAARDRSKSLSVDRPPSAASSSASHASNATSNSNSTSASGRKRFLGLGKDKERERERQRIREAERGAPSAEELLAASPTEYDDDFAPSSYGGTARPRPRTRSERHFSASTPPASSSSSSNGHSHPNPHGGNDLTLARTPSRLGVSDGALATRLSGWFAHLAGSTNDLSIASTISGSLATARAVSPTTSRKAASAHGHTSHSSSSHHASSTHHTASSTKSSTKNSGGGAKTSLLDKAVRYLLDGDASPDRSAEEIWLMGVRLPGWGVDDEMRVAAAAHAAKDGKEHGLTAGGGHGLSSSKRRSGSKQRDLPPPPPDDPSPSRDPNADAEDEEQEDIDTAPPDPGPWPALFHAAFYAHVWCTYRAGFEPIRDLPSLGSLPPPLCFPSLSLSGASSMAGSASNLTASASTGATIMPPPTSPRGAGGGGGGGGGHSDSSGSGRGSVGGSVAGSSVGYASSYSYNSYAGAPSSPSSASSTKKKWWPLSLSAGTGGTKGWTSDAGWGCMLRTSQSLLATALGRVGEPSLHPSAPPPFPPPNRTAHALHARLISWFLDAPAAPFGVHRMALAGKAAGKDVGMWFGPSAAASALRMLVDAFPACGLGVSVATDGTLYQTEVFAASHSPSSPALLSAASSVSSSHGHGSSSSHRGSSSSHGGHANRKDKEKEKRWGDRPVLLLLGIRLGLDGVNPIYYETVKRLYTFPQSVGIAGGRPSSSYYFVGVQGDGLFYLDPHHSRPAVPLRPLVSEGIPRSPGHAASPSSSSHGHASPSSSHAHERRSLSPEAAYARGGSTSPESASGSSFARGGSMSPELLYAPGHGHGRGGSLSPEFGHGHGVMTEDELVVVRPPHASRAASSHGGQNEERYPAGGPMSSAEEAYYARAYTAAEMRTFHCERVRKMPMSGLDPSMLLGFVCRDEAEWVDLRRRIKELPRTIFAIQDEPPTWPGADDDDDMLESISDPEEEVDVGVDDGDVSTTSHAASSTSHATSSASHVPASAFSHTHAHHGSNSTTHSASTSNSSKSGARSEVDTEEDSVAPVTPLPNARFDLGPPQHASAKGMGMSKGRERTVGQAYAELVEEGDGEDDFVDASGEVDDIEDDWVDPMPPPPPPVPKKSSSSKDKDKDKEKDRSGKSKTKGKSKKATPVPVPSVHYPFPVSAEDGAGGTGRTSPRERERERERNVTVSPRVAGASAGGQRMHTARARDGGRTQSGGVRGILTED